mmetsp:Transcript_12078/g.20972  ORF Transcript_12078/g.20972 Transcript_12078/m.20972 type:complete len:91 (-) Transcript_12078:585-857(-)|eukprot:CAMPEP_0196658134 /NCGR_PEP_ID=MMETSP1086-20130531/27514_1 /TAXON_ID=77921 /ORGANISM="Cyanoptyche  gloeocystis , Strain SAG4.97" /LENGTH=90 /DNA_ID=CAMNT_0041991565 /DNA_START=151 /DNA_END=423 /DNA_ORIENTATION=+
MIFFPSLLPNLLRHQQLFPIPPEDDDASLRRELEELENELKSFRESSAPTPIGTKPKAGGEDDDDGPADGEDEEEGYEEEEEEETAADIS